MPLRDVWSPEGSKLAFTGVAAGVIIGCKNVDMVFYPGLSRVVV